MAGIITERDFLKLPLKPGASRATLVSEIMTPAASIVTAPSSHTLDRCVAQMRKAKVRHLPVVENDTVKAVISMADICQQIAVTMKKRDPLEDTLTVGDLLDHPDVKTPGTSVSLGPEDNVANAINLMRQSSNGSLLVMGAGGDVKTFGIFTERDYLNKVVLYDDVDPASIELREVATFTSGTSKRTMQAIAGNAPTGTYLPSHVTCVERTTRVTDCLALMLGNGFLYVPVTEAKKPVDVISMRDINLFLAPPE